MRLKIKFVVIIIFCVSIIFNLLITSEILAEDINVAVVEKIQPAINEALTNSDNIDYIYIAAGTFEEQIIIVIPSGQEIHLIGSGPDNTIISLPSGLTGNVISADGGGKIFIEGMKIMNGTRSGIRINNSTELTIQNCEISNNIGNIGAGIYNYGSTLNINNSTISNNSATLYGGGIYNDGTLSIINSKLTDNISTNGQGGAIYNLGNLTVSNSSISNNSAASYGGIASINGIPNIINMANENWWGSELGPYNAANNPLGVGNSIADNVSFSPFLTSDPFLPVQQEDNLPPDEGNGSDDVPPPISGNENGSDDVPPPISGNENGSDDVPPPISDEGNGSDDVPPPISGNENGSDNVPPPISGDENGSDDVPPPISGDENGSDDVSPPISGDENGSDDVSPPISGDENSTNTVNNSPPNNSNNLLQDEGNGSDDVSPPISGDENGSDDVSPPVSGDENSTNTVNNSPLNNSNNLPQDEGNGSNDDPPSVSGNENGSDDDPPPISGNENSTNTVNNSPLNNSNNILDSNYLFSQKSNYFSLNHYLNFYSSPPKGFISLLYHSILGREPDIEGLDYWQQILESNSKNASDIAECLFFSEENISSIEEFDNSDFIKYLYQSILFREYDINGYNDWLSCMNAGATKQYLFNSFVASKERSDICSKFKINP